MPLQIFGDFSSVPGISPVIRNFYKNNIHHSLSSFGHSETSFPESAAGGSSLAQSTPSLEPPAATEHVLEDQQDSVSVSHKEAGGGVKSSEINHSNSLLKVPVRDISSPYNRLRHPGRTDYQSTSSEAEATVLEVSLSIPDHSDQTPPEELADPSHFKKQHEIDGYLPANENELDSNLTTADKLTNHFHSDEQQHLLDDANGSKYKMKTGELNSTKLRYNKLTFEKKLSAGQLV